MEINFAENTNCNPEKYWESGKQTVPPTSSKKKKVSFDDILSNMNLVVSENGVLQFMRPNQELSTQNNDTTMVTPPSYKPILVKKEPVDPSVKNSYIYNKYFSDYRDVNQCVPEIKIPKTKQEYIRMLLIERIKKEQEKKRVSQIKSTKLLFTTTTNANTNNIIQQPKILASNTELRKMNFR